MSKKTHPRDLDDSDAGLQPRTFPIQHLPFDVLAEIFVCCLPGPTEEKEASPRRAPLLLCSVCTSWRAVATSTPRLWSRFEFYLNMSHFVDMGGIVKGMHSWLGLSGTLPLILSLDSDSQGTADNVQPLCDVLYKYASRWEDVQLCPPKSWPTLGNAPLLQRLHIEGSADGLPFTSTPSLTILTIRIFFGMPRNVPSIPWHQLTRLTISHGLGCYTILDLIRCCSRLEPLTLHFIGDFFAMDMPCCPRIKHNTLQSIQMLFFVDCRLVLKSLSLPALTSLDLGYDIDTEDVVFENGSFYQEFFDFLSHSGCTLQQLALTHPGFSPDQLLECLSHKSCHALGSLFIKAYYDELVGDEFFIRLTYFEKAETTPLCPKLKDLTLSKCSSEGPSPGLLGKMVWSRFFGREEEDRLKSLRLTIPWNLLDEDNVYLKEAKANGLEVSVYYS